MKQAITVGIVGLAFLFVSTTGWAHEGSDHAKGDREQAQSSTKEESEPTIYTCPMNPEVQQAKPGNCPKCGMKLVESDTEETDKEHDHKASERAGSSEAKPSGQHH